MPLSKDYSVAMNKSVYCAFTRNSPGFKRKDSANLEAGLKICIRGQFFVPNKTGRGTRSIFKCTPSKNAFFSKKKTLKLR